MEKSGTVWGRRLWRFTKRVWRGFRANKILLLASALAYNALLSIIPLFAVLLVGLSTFVDERTLLDIVNRQLDLIVPGQSGSLMSELTSVLAGRAALGWVGVGVALFFSSLAFRMLEEAMSVIFGRNKVEARHPWVSFLIPYAYVFAVAVVLSFLTVLTTFLDSFAGRELSLFGQVWVVGQDYGLVWAGLGFVGLVLMFASIYMVMPTARVAFGRAVVGGVVAAVLWEITRLVLVWYFGTVSMVSVVYGSLASVVIVLFSFEVGAIEVLIGAQVIAELERSDEAGLLWYEEPKAAPVDESLAE